MSELRFPTVLSDVESLNNSWRDARLLTKHILTEKLSVSRSQFTSSSKIAADLGGDSLDLVEIAIALEKTTGIRVNERVPFNYVLEIVDYLHFIRTWEK
uniref:Acyl carrier protein n=1 Tax=Eustigmatophyceae sp. Ndem 8/9T-3m6.8 TaxID=2506146 RepID=A0A410D2F2_9STRA|nr:acyl carrier protein [Eustigmatophyceae sp. Ndem 8/9T-3m6.8]QAA11900.1 acyl carrier protein [Eustigmatophyceae sp. Ndem 8/9T-3m6.8]